MRRTTRPSSSPLEPVAGPSRRVEPREVSSEPGTAARVLIPFEDLCQLVEERFRNALIADMVASRLGREAPQTVRDAQQVAEEYVARIRAPAREAATPAIAEGDWTMYADLLPSFLDVLEPTRLPSRRGRPAQTPGTAVLAALRRYDEILLQFQAGRVAPELIREHGRGLAPDKAVALADQSSYYIAAELAVLGTRIKAKTLIHRYAPRLKVGRLHTIANELGVWTREGKRRRSWRFREVRSPDGATEVDLEPAP